MNTQWLSFGTQVWYQDVVLVPHPSGVGMTQEYTEWYTGRNAPRPAPGGDSVARWRIGEPALMRAAAGKVIRGYDFAGRFFRSPRNTTDLHLMLGVLFAPPSMRIGPANLLADYALTAEAAPSNKPLGAYFSAADMDAFEDDTAMASAAVWGGASSGWVTTHLPTPPEMKSRITYPAISRFNVLVSDPPRWVASPTASPEIGLDETEELTLRFDFPGAAHDPVVGLNVGLSSGGGVVFQTSTGTWANVVSAATNAEGEVTFTLRGAQAGTALVTVALAGEDAHAQHAYSPALPALFLCTVVAPPSAPAPGECTTYPAVPEVPGTPARVEVSENYGWNTGANSVDEHDGDVELVFSGQPRVVGAVIGLTPTRDDVGSKDRMTHAFYFSQSQGGQRLFQVMESGQTATATAPYEEEDGFKLQRANGVVSYLHNGRVVFVSRARSEGTVSAGCAMYAASDRVPTTGVSAPPVEVETSIAKVLRDGTFDTSYPTVQSLGGEADVIKAFPDGSLIVRTYTGGPLIIGGQDTGAAFVQLTPSGSVHRAWSEGGGGLLLWSNARQANEPYFRGWARDWDNDAQEYVRSLLLPGGGSTSVPAGIVWTDANGRQRSICRISGDGDLYITSGGPNASGWTIPRWVDIDRYLPDGSLDPSFTTIRCAGGTSIGVDRVAVWEADGYLYVVHAVTSSRRSFFVRRFNLDGTLDNTVSAPSISSWGASNTPPTVAGVWDDRIVLSGNPQWNSTNYVLLVLDLDLQVDPSLSVASTNFEGEPYEVNWHSAVYCQPAEYAARVNDGEGEARGCVTGSAPANMATATYYQYGVRSLWGVLAPAVAAAYPTHLFVHTHPAFVDWDYEP